MKNDSLNSKGETQVVDKVKGSTAENTSITSTEDGKVVDTQTGEILSPVDNTKKADEEKKGSEKPKATIIPISSDPDKTLNDTSVDTTQSKGKTTSETDKPKTLPARKNDDVKTDEDLEKGIIKEENAMRQEVAKLPLLNLDVKLMYDMMSVPTFSRFEYRMVTYLILWARKHNIDHKFDTYGNLYLTKGKPDEGHFYPCVTAHLDTVQHQQKAYLLAGSDLELRTRVNDKKQHEVYISGMGTGSDDKNAILIALQMFEKFDALKGAFFLEEESGCVGSNNLDESFFDDVSYVIGFDSPELNRAAWHLSNNVKMFTADFYKTYMKPICDKWGMTKFYSETITDEMYITSKTGLVTMNFGNGGYKPHLDTEYFIIEELDHALSMGLELVETIPTDRQHKVKGSTWTRDPETHELRKVTVTETDDTEYLRSLGDNSKWNGYYGGNYSNSHSSSTNSSSSSTTIDRSDGYFNKGNDKHKDDVPEETVKYIVDTYDQRITDIEKTVKDKCKELNIDFEKVFGPAFSKEIIF